MERYTNPDCKPEMEELMKDCPRSRSGAECWLRLRDIEDILGDEYDLDELREMVEADKTLKEFAEDVARQFGYHGTTADGRPAYTCGGLSTLEWAWNILDWPDPKPAPECECQEEGCHEWATGGRPTSDGYKWLCGRHFAAYEAREEAEAALRRERRPGMAEKNCKDCAYCNVRQFNRGRWYCNSPEVSVFIPVPYEKPCFKPRKGKRKPEGEEDT